MKLSELIKGIDIVKIIGDTDIDIKDVKTDSRTVYSDTLFICLNGSGFDGHNFVKDACFYGARAIITEKEVDCTVTQIVVKDTRSCLSIVASNFYERSDKKLKLVGITGTNGKTSTTYILKSILDSAGVKCGIIGTLGVYYDGKFFDASLTTPDPMELHKYFYEMVKCGVKVVIMEVSAHALYLNKIEGLNFEAGIFTNLTQDHLDFFGNIDNYKAAKLKFFDKSRCKYIIVNSDDKVGLEIINKFDKVISYGIDNPADVFAIRIEGNGEYTSYILNLFDYIYEVKSALIGKFNVYNSLAAATAAAMLGVKPEKIILGLQNVETVSGRMELVYVNKYSVYVDYAHTPDGLEKSLLSLKDITDGRLICVFGCGGNRDKGKRRMMGKISGTIADFTVITSDNPRFEEPMEIIREIEEGIVEVTKKYVIVQDRLEAIKYAMEYAKSGDNLLIAGKGSEKYQDVLGVKHIFNDKDAVLEIAKK